MLLVIHNNPAHANTISDIFNFMGILSYGTTPERAVQHLSNRHRAVIFVHPEQMISLKELVTLIKSFSLDTSVFAISDNEFCDSANSPEIYSLFDRVFADGAPSSSLIYSIIDYQSCLKRETIGSYRLAGIDASINNALPTYFDRPINLTKSESMILRFLIASYPIKKSAKEIMKYAFRIGKAPEPSSLRSHISHINAKFNDIFGKNVISCEAGAGYSVTLN